MIGFIRNKSLPARRYLVLLVLPWCLMLLLTVAVLWPYLVGFRTTVKTLQDVQLPGILEAQRTRANLNMLRKQLAIIYLAEAPLERRRARLHAQALLAGMQESQKTLAQALEKLNAAATSAQHDLPQALQSTRDAMNNVSSVSLATKAVVERNAPLTQELRRLIQESAAAVRSLRAFMDVLERNPEALLRGKQGSRR